MTGAAGWRQGLSGEDGPPPREPPRWPPLRSAAGLAAAYLVAAWLSTAIGRQPGSIATIGFANAIGVAYLAFRPLRGWPLPMLALAMAALAGAQLGGMDFATALRRLGPTVLEVAAGAALLRHMGLHRDTLRSAPALLKLWLAGGVAPQVAGALLAALLLASHEGVQRPLWLQWLEGATIGSIAMLPVAFLFFRGGWPPFGRALRDARVVALMALSVAVTLLAMTYVPYPFIYMVLPLLVTAMATEWVAVALTHVLVAVAMALSLGLGVFVPVPTTAQWQTVYLYLAFAAALVPGQLLAAVLAELRDSHDRLAHHSHALRRSNEALEQFVRIASHDLREPLNTVVQFGSLIRSDHQDRLPPEGRHYLELVCSAAGRMRTLLDDVLQYARLQGGEPGPPEPVALEPLLAEVMSSLAGRVRESGATLQAPPLPVVLGHPALLSLLLQNLLSNALKFVPSGRPPRVEITVREQGGDAWLTVADNGIGIAEADLPRLFRPFQRLNLRRHYEGTGLGLALCRQIAQLHGGEIHVASAPGSGSQFTVRLPLAKTQGAGAPRPADH